MSNKIRKKSNVKTIIILLLIYSIVYIHNIYKYEKR